MSTPNETGCDLNDRALAWARRDPPMARLREWGYGSKASTLLALDCEEARSLVARIRKHVRRGRFVKIEDLPSGRGMKVALQHQPDDSLVEAASTVFIRPGVSLLAELFATRPRSEGQPESAGREERREHED